MKAKFLLFVSSIVLISCSTQTVDSTTKTQSSPQPSVTPELTQSTSNSNPDTPTSKALIISANGIGTAKLGMTFGQLKQALGKKAEFKIVSPFMVDIDAIAISKSGKVQYYILYPAGTTFSDANSIELLLTENPNFRTVEGVGSGMFLEQVETVYGEATLSYNTQNESREQVRFANQPAQNVTFQPTAPNQIFAGIYPFTSGEYNETKNFYESALIRSALVQKNYL